MSEEKSENPIDSMRVLNRAQFGLLRKENRYKATTIQRGCELDNLKSRNYSPSDVNTMAITLKKKKAINQTLLTQLSQALAISKENATAFSKNDGALQALCSFLTGIYCYKMFNYFTKNSSNKYLIPISNQAATLRYSLKQPIV